MGETVDGVSDLLDSMFNASAFQFDENACVLLWIGWMVSEEIIAFVMGCVVIEMSVNLVFVNYGSVAADNRKLTLVFLHRETRCAIAL